MRIDADISLCYGLNITYEDCTVPVIIENLYEKSNLYNEWASSDFDILGVILN